MDRGPCREAEIRMIRWALAHTVWADMLAAAAAVVLLAGWCFLIFIFGGEKNGIDRN